MDVGSLKQRVQEKMNSLEKNKIVEYGPMATSGRQKRNTNLGNKRIQTQS